MMFSLCKTPCKSDFFAPAASPNYVKIMIITRIYQILQNPGSLTKGGGSNQWDCTDGHRPQTSRDSSFRVRNTTKSQPFRAGLSWKFAVLAAQKAVLRGSKKRGLDKKKRGFDWKVFRAELWSIISDPALLSISGLVLDSVFILQLTCTFFRLYKFSPGGNCFLQW